MFSTGRKPEQESMHDSEQSYLEPMPYYEQPSRPFLNQYLRKRPPGEV